MGANERIEGHTRINVFDQLQWAISSPRRHLVTLGILAAIFSALGVFLDYSNYGVVDGETFSTIAKAVLVSFVAIFLVSTACLLYFTMQLSAAQKEMSWAIDGNQIALHDATGTQIVILWSIVKQLGVRSSGFLVELRPRGSRWIPTRAFSESQRAAIIETARAAGVLKK